MKKPGFPKEGAAVSDYAEVILKENTADKIIKETYPLEEKKKLTVRYTLGTMTWRGDPYESATPEISYCCEEARGLQFGNNSINPATFKRVLYQGEPVSSCPFCGAEIEIKENK